MFADEFEGFVLAGGKSSRMGEDKALLKFNGKTLIQNAVDALSPVCENRVKVVLNPDRLNLAGEIPDGVSYVTDLYSDRGAVGGLYTALKNCSAKYAIVLAVDLPLVSSEIIEKLAEITLTSNKFMAVVPKQIDGRLQPLCAVYLGRYAVRPLEKLMAENPTASANDFLDIILPRWVKPEMLTPGSDRDIFLNVNSPGDYETLTEQN